MLNFQVVTDKDRREAAAIEKRRILDEERKKRIFNPKARLYGVDHDVVLQQIEEKKRRDEEEKRITKIFNDEILKADQVVLALANKEQKERIKHEQEINHFRRTCQRFEDRREFDLNDPKQRRYQLPARLHDDDPRCGPSSAQKFQGEDSKNEQRQKLQREQIKAWLDQQLREKEQADKERIAAEEAYNAAVIARDQRAMELDAMEKKCRKQLEQACSRFNRALADERFCEEQNMKKRTQDDNLAEICNTVSSDMLTENPDVAQSNMGPDRKIGYLYKGMTDEERQQFKDYQKMQLEEAKQRKELEKRRNSEMDDYIIGTQKTVQLLSDEMEQKKKRMQKDLAEENRKLAVEQRNQQEYLNKMVYTNRITPEFFDQFNKTSR